MKDPDFEFATQDEAGETTKRNPISQQLQSLGDGRYRVQRILGKGGFGVVYLARDNQLDRLVALKVPHATLVSAPEDADLYLTEARTVAGLDHANIVPVFDVGSSDQCPCFIVSKYIEGTNLSTKLKHQKLSWREAAELVAIVADALHYAHKQGLVHRDIKPGNILISEDGRPHVVDFGLALREENVGKGPKYVGTPAYMSPEQARGEGHRVDGRSDIFSLGVVFYELLIGRRPFRADTHAKILEQVTSYEPRPLRQYDESLPKELERICHKAMAKRARERYSSAHDLANDIRHFLAQQTVVLSTAAPQTVPAETHATQASATAATSIGAGPTALTPAHSQASDSEPIRIVPKGLRSFDAHDADFFLELLPGARDRNGLPDSLRFWKTRIEETDTDSTFTVGLIYGPSGCGKSSLVKAGLLPRLSDDVIPIYVEATPDETESRLLHGIRKRCRAVDDDKNLKDTLAALRRGQGIPVNKKVLIVIDQFEQWLHANTDEENSELVQALRQCDGGRVQCIVLVRDDFWMAVTRFLRELEVRLLEDHNLAAVDLFPERHAVKVLSAFGRAFGTLSESSRDLSKEQTNFLDQSAAGLARDGKVVCVRLALFAEMMKAKEWTPAVLKKVGGTKGIGVTFLEETFSSSTASPGHRYHQKAARAVLKALLPDSGTDIKGQMKSHDDLLAASGYARRRNDFDDLLQILDSDIRLITPTDPAGVEEEQEPASDREVGERFYQLTHDYLVPSLREWLTRKQKETRRGRAQLQLAERSALWNAKRENRRLPTWWENIRIRLFTEKKNWTGPQRTMMSAAAWLHGVRTALLAGAILAITFVGLGVRHRIVQSSNATSAEGLVDSLISAEITRVPAVVSELQPLRQWADPLLSARLAAATDGSAEKLHLALALLPVDDSQIDYLRGQLPRCTLAKFPVVRDALLPHKEALTDQLWQIVHDPQAESARRFQAAAALAQYAPDDDERWNQVSTFVAQHLTSAVSSVHVGGWLENFRSARRQLTEPLTAIHADRQRSETQRETAALALVDYLRDQPEKLVNVILVADQIVEFSPLIASLGPHSAAVRQTLLDELHTPLPADLESANEELSREQQRRRDAHWQRQSMAAATLVHLGYGTEVWPLLEFSADPSLRSFVIEQLGKLGADHNTLAERLEKESEVSIRRALIQSLGGLDPTLLPPADRKRIAQQLRELHQQDPDAGIHGSTSWTLRQWAVTLPELPRGEPELSEKPGSSKQPGSQRWYVNCQGQTMVMFQDPMGSSDGRIDHPFAISSQEVTVAEFRRFKEGHRVNLDSAPSEDCPVHYVDWYAAAAYCNWLSQQAGFPQDQWVYEANDDGQFAEGMKIRDNARALGGYRLPTEAEWDHACRAGTTETYSFGQPVPLLHLYGRFVLNSSGRGHPVGGLRPNEAGLFDMHGNLWEWIQSPAAGPMSPVGNDFDRLLCGGAYYSLTTRVRNDSRHELPPNDLSPGFGFRVARSYEVAR